MFWREFADFSVLLEVFELLSLKKCYKTALWFSLSDDYKEKCEGCESKKLCFSVTRARGWQFSMILLSCKVY